VDARGIRSAAEIGLPLRRRASGFPEAIAGVDGKTELDLGGKKRTLPRIDLSQLMLDAAST